MTEKENNLKPLEIRSRLTDKEDQDMWDKIKRDFGTKKDAIAVKILIRKYYDLTTTKTEVATQ